MRYVLIHLSRAGTSDFPKRCCITPTPGPIPSPAHAAQHSNGRPSTQRPSAPPGSDPTRAAGGTGPFIASFCRLLRATGVGAWGPACRFLSARKISLPLHHAGSSKPLSSLSPPSTFLRRPFCSRLPHRVSFLFFIYPIFTVKDAGLASFPSCTLQAFFFLVAVFCRKPPPAPDPLLICSQITASPSYPFDGSLRRLHQSPFGIPIRSL